MTRPASRCHALTIGTHWLTLLLLIGVYALIELLGVFPKGSALHDDMNPKMTSCKHADA